jgi:hypothetical protein
MLKLALHQREIFSPFTHCINLFWIRHILWDRVIEFNRVGIFVVRSVIGKEGLEERNPTATLTGACSITQRVVGTPNTHDPDYLPLQNGHFAGANFGNARKCRCRDNVYDKIVIQENLGYPG